MSGTARRGRWWRPGTWRGRAALAAGLCVGVPVLLAAVLAVSVWSESRYPSDAPDSSLAARARGVVTRPIVGAVGGHVRRRVRTLVQRRMLPTGWTVEEAIAALADPSLPADERRRCAYVLARSGSPAAVAALVEALRRAPPEDRGWLAQLLGTTGDPSVAAVLRPLLLDPDERVVIAALRGLAALRGDAATPLLVGILADPGRGEAVRIEAVLGLGQVRTPAARRALEAAFEDASGADFATEVLIGLGRFPFEEVAGTFERVVAAHEKPLDIRVAAVEALVSSSAEAAPFLLRTAESDRSPDVRASAAWALCGQDAERRLGATLTALAEREREPDVRRRLYEATLQQTDTPAARLLASVSAETDVAARVAGCNAIGQAVGRGAPEEVATVFDDQLVPELTSIALAEGNLNIRMRAVFALRRARTAAALDALIRVADSPCPQVAAAARHGLPKRE